MVEQKPSKLKTRVRSPSPAPRFIQLFGICPCSSVAEHSLGKGEVGSSILPMGTRLLVFPDGVSSFCVFYFFDLRV